MKLLFVEILYRKKYLAFPVSRLEIPGAPHSKPKAYMTEDVRRYLPKRSRFELKCSNFLPKSSRFPLKC